MREDSQCEGAARSFARAWSITWSRRERRFHQGLEIQGVGFKAAVQGTNPQSQPRLFASECSSRFRKDIKITVDGKHQDQRLGHRQESRRPGRGRHSPLLPAGALQGQRRALRRRTDSPQGRQDRSVVMATTNRKIIRDRIHSAHSRKVSRHGGASASRASIFPGKHVYAQVIDDEAGRTLVCRRHDGEGLGRTRQSCGQSRDGGEGRESWSRSVCSRRKIDKVVFDRGGFLYHGKVKALADAAREGGLKF